MYRIGSDPFCSALRGISHYGLFNRFSVRDITRRGVDICPCVHTRDGLAVRPNQQEKKLAWKLVSDKELSEFMGLWFDMQGNANCYYKPAKFPRQVSSGVGGYSFMMTQMSYKTAPDPRPVLAANTNPVLVIRGNYEWLPKRIAQEYVDAFPNGQFREMQNCGHLLYIEKPEEYYRVVEEFLSRVSSEYQ